MGKIITFYSYKGGTGRSMALANVAWILASNGKRVLAVDWDLEGPGLHRYFRPFLLDKELSMTEGLIDFVLNYVTEAITPAGSEAEPHWYKRHANIMRYAVSLEWDFPNGGALDFVSAGRQGSDYASRVTSFNWQSFYDRLGGGAFFEAAKERMRSEYDYVLIDSRTGVSDTTGVCLIQMPDALVVCFTLNKQNVEGSAKVAEDVQAQRGGEEGSTFNIFPVPMRVELSEKRMMDDAMWAARHRFSSFPNYVYSGSLDEYWKQVPFLYTPYYAYGEIIPVFGDQPFLTYSLLASAERLTAYLTAGEVTQSVPTSDDERQRVLAEYLGHAGMRPQ
jgi:hypothetical protein